LPRRRTANRRRKGTLIERRETERVVLAALVQDDDEAAYDLAELRELVSTAGGEVADVLTQRRSTPSPSHYLGKGKAEELLDLVVEHEADLVVVDAELSPGQQQNLAQTLNCRVIDRTQLILDIFARRARSSEGKVQVELAQLTYLLPRITAQYTEFEQQRGGIGMRGPGETQLASERSRIRRRIAALKKELDNISKHRAIARANRERDALPTVALVGYTSAGKSTLLNALAGADVYVDAKLFATLDPTTRRVRLPSTRSALVSDTVGFIRKLPTFLVAAFRATLEETILADMLIHVVDAGHPQRDAQIEAVIEVLEDLEIADKPVITALNKIDLVQDIAALRQWVLRDARTVYVSALTGDGVDDLRAMIDAVVAETRDGDDAPVVAELSHAGRAV